MAISKSYDPKPCPECDGVMEPREGCVACMFCGYKEC